MAVLKVIQGKRPGGILELWGDRILLGRHPSCQIVIDNTAVSRNHAQILENHGSYYLEDMRSRNGTQLNGISIHERVPLHEGDLIQICDDVFSFHYQAPTPSDARSDATFLASPDFEQHTSERQNANPSQGKSRNKLGDSDDFILDSSSSIINSIDVSSLEKLRLEVHPENKLRAILEVSHVMGQTLDLETLLPKILDCLLKIFPAADRAIVMLRDAEDQSLVIREIRYRRQEMDQGDPVSRQIVERAMESRQAILSEDAISDQRFEESHSVANLKLRSVMCVPLVVPNSKDVLGAIQVDSRDLRYRFGEEDLELLAAVATQSVLALDHARLYEQKLKQHDLERDLEFATQVQLGFLPTERPRLAGYEFFDYYEAAQRVGGDFFDYVTLNDGRLAVAVGDVAGKGVPAALLMARLYSQARFSLLTSKSPAQAVTSLNESISSCGLGHRFITFLLIVIDPRKHVLQIVNAGHLAPVIRRATGVCEALAQDKTGLPLGVAPEIPYQQIESPIRPGESLFLFTDGMTEAMNPRNEIYGNSRLLKFLSQPVNSIASLGQALVSDVEHFCEGRAQRDDICLVCFRHQA